MFTHLPPGQQQAGTRLNTHESGAAFDRKKTRFLKVPLTHPGLFFIVLPDQDGVTLEDLQRDLQHQQVSPSQLRLSVLLEALQHLQHAGLVASTANQPEDDLYRRRYWRVPTTGKQLI